MTRFARGGSANKKKPHDATEWKNMGIKHVDDQNKMSAPTTHKKVSETRISVSKPIRNKKKSKLKPKLLGNVGLDLKTTDTPKAEDALSFLTSSGNVSGGLAAELEQINTLKDERKSKETQRMVNKGQKHEASWDKHSKVEKDKLLKTELTKYLTSVKKDSVLDKNEQEEVDELIKKDQRREKRRLKRKNQKSEGRMCFNCRETGHTVAECPEKNEQKQGTGICFKCGSTEHSLNWCKVRLPAGRYPYAKCFICGEQGHLSNQCPDNPKGLYPKGGCCANCSSVEHFKKDCPVLQKEQGISSFAIERITSSFDNTERDPSLERKAYVKKKQPKIVKF